MIDNFAGKTAVLTGAGSGFGLECARIGARLGMNLVLVDVQQDALDAAAAEMRAAGAQVLAQRVDVSNAARMEALGAAVLERFGAPHLVFNNAGVGAGGCACCQIPGCLAHTGCRQRPAIARDTSSIATMWAR